MHFDEIHPKKGHNIPILIAIIAHYSIISVKNQFVKRQFQNFGNNIGCFLFCNDLSAPLIRKNIFSAAPGKSGRRGLGEAFSTPTEDYRYSSFCEKSTKTARGKSSQTKRRGSRAPKAPKKRKDPPLTNEGDLIIYKVEKRM